MTVTIEIELEEKDHPSYASRVNAILQFLAADADFVLGAIPNGYKLRTTEGTATVTYKK